MTGLWTMIRLILRRDRIKLPLMAGGAVLFLIAMVPLLHDLYGDTESIAALHATMSLSPTMLFMTGPIDAATFGSLVTIKTLLWWGIAFAIINTLLVVRHTRRNEEIGAQELLLSGQLHRASSLVAVLVVALGLNALIALGIGAGFELVNDGYWPAESSWLYGLAMGAFGFVWACIAAVVVQLVESGRTANGMIAALVGVAFLVRGVGDFMGSTNSAGVHEAALASGFSPFGWMQATRPLIDPQWGALWLPLIVSAVLVVASFVLLARRDVGAGLLPSRKGKQRASRLLGTPAGLTWKLQKNVFFGWFAGIVTMTVTIGALVPQLSDVYGDSDMIEVIQAIGGVGELIPTFMSAMMAIMCMMVFGYAIHALGKLRSEEASGHLENVLATQMTRTRWLGLHVGMVFVGGVIMLAMIGGLLAILTNTMSEFSMDVWEYTVSSLSYVSLLAAFMGLYVVLFGLLPRIASGITWFYFGFVFFALWLGPIVQLDQWVMNLSILEHLTTPPAEDIAWQSLGIIATVAVSLIAIGFAAFRRRDVRQ